MVSWFTKNKSLVLIVGIFVLFLVLRVPSLDRPFYQDERIWVGLEGRGINDLSGIPHPPLSALTYLGAVNLFGVDHLRYLPFLLGIANFWLLFLLVKNQFSRTAAIWSVFFFSIGYFSILASLMLDTDGQLLPLFFLLSVTAYYKWRGGIKGRRRLLWIAILGLSILCGFLVKVSFIIAFIAIILDFLYSRAYILSRSQLLKTIFVIFGLLVVALLIVLASLLLLSNSNSISESLSSPVSYWKHFFVLSGRNYLQITVQAFKALIYASPLFVLPLLFLTRDLARKLRLFLLYISLGLIFYLVLFDFSSGALDRYLQFVIVPMSLIAGVVMKNIFHHPGTQNGRKFLLASFIIMTALFLAQFLSHSVPALYPKAEWFNDVITLRWNFLLPFTGGSGPMGFYVSWLFIGLTWLLTIVLAFAALIKVRYRRIIWVMILMIGFLYNGIFIEEYTFGKINGSSPTLLKHTTAFIKSNENIRKIITYNNIGNFELGRMGKFEGRLYVAPKFEANYIDILNNFTGHYLVIDVPRIDPESPYSKLFSSCSAIYEEHSRAISSKIYDCNEKTH